MKLIPLAWEYEGDCIRCISHRPKVNRYVLITRKGKSMSVCRRLMSRRHGVLQRHIVCRHSCDNAWCINPAHLSIGTHHDNTMDCVNRGRHRYGIRSKLSQSDVEEIRKSTLSGRKLARLYPVGKSQIQRIKAGKEWVHINAQAA